LQQGSLRHRRTYPKAFNLFPAARLAKDQDPDGVEIQSEQHSGAYRQPAPFGCFNSRIITFPFKLSQAKEVACFRL
jgi:hypothetical protein